MSNDAVVSTLEWFLTFDLPHNVVVNVENALDHARERAAAAAPDSSAVCGIDFGHEGGPCALVLNHPSQHKPANQIPDSGAVGRLYDALAKVVREFDYWVSKPRPAIGGPLAGGTAVRIHNFLEVQAPMERALDEARAALVSAPAVVVGEAGE